MQAAPSGNLEAGKILLLVGAIVSAFTALVLVLIALGLGAMGQLLGDGPFGGPAGPVIAIAYGVIGLLGAAGSIVGFVAFGRARAGDARGARVRGLVASLLPPVQPVTLIGAVLCKVSPECRQQTQGGPYQPPGVTWNAPR